SGWRAWWIAPRAPGEAAVVLSLAAGVPPSPAAAADPALRESRYEQDLVYGTLTAQGEGDDRWYWTELRTGGATSASVTLAVPVAPDPASAGLLRLTLQGMYDSPDQ